MFDLEEQEKVDLIKSWWETHRKKVYLGVAAAAVVFVAFNGYRYWKHAEADRAGQAFASFEEAVKGGDLAKVRAMLQPLETSSSSSPYAARAALETAQFLVTGKDVPGAIEQYQWVIDHSSEPALLALARIRKAGLLADQQKFDEALKLLDSNIDPAFEGMARDRAGDIYLAQDKKDEARKAYEAALKAMDTKHPLVQVVTIKLDALGGPSESKAQESK